MAKKQNENWKEHWKNMPEYVQENKEAIKRVAINFESEAAIEEFNKLTGLNITMKTKGIFFPPVDNRKIKYVEEN